MAGREAKRETDQAAGDRSGARPSREAGPAGPERAPRRAGNTATAGGSVRVDSWIWCVRLTKTRSLAATACRAGHVRVNGERVKPAQAVRVGDEVRLVHAGRERVVVVSRLVSKRVGA